MAIVATEQLWGTFETLRDHLFDQFETPPFDPETGVPPEVFIDKMAANHVHVAPGDCVEELLHFCAMSEIEPVVLN